MMNWRQIYGDDEFAVRASILWSDIVRRRKRREVDMEELKQRAIEYAKTQCQTYHVSYDDVAQGEKVIEWPPMKKEVDLEARVDRVSRQKSASTSTTTPATTTIKTEVQETGDISEDLPSGWAATTDPNGRVYYWHKETKAVQWDKPTAAP